MSSKTPLHSEVTDRKSETLKRALWPVAVLPWVDGRLIPSHMHTDCNTLACRKSQHALLLGIVGVRLGAGWILGTAEYQIAHRGGDCHCCELTRFDVPSVRR